MNAVDLVQYDACGSVELLIVLCLQLTKPKPTKEEREALKREREREKALKEQQRAEREKEKVEAKARREQERLQRKQEKLRKEEEKRYDAACSTLTQDAYREEQQICG